MASVVVVAAVDKEEDYDVAPEVVREGVLGVAHEVVHENAHEVAHEVGYEACMIHA